MRRVVVTSVVVAVLTVAGITTATSASQSEVPSVPQPTETLTEQPEWPPPPALDLRPRSESDLGRSLKCPEIQPEDDGLGAEPLNCELVPPWWDTPIEPLEPYRGSGRVELLEELDPS